MGLKAGKRYRHPRCLDVDIRVSEVLRDDEVDQLLEVVWLNRNYPHVIHQDVIRIKKEDLNMWEEVV